MPEKNEILIDYLDNRLDDSELEEFENKLQQNESLKVDLQFLKLAVDSVRLNAIKNKVSEVRKSFVKNNASDEKPALITKRSFPKLTVRIAAVLIVLLGSAVLLKYFSVTNLSIYKKQFTSYELSNARGLELHDDETEAYQNKNWNAVISLYHSGRNNSNKSAFLAAMSQMQLNQFPEAIKLFENILTTNQTKGDNSFQEESEYYLSLAYLMNHQAKQSISLMEKIRKDTSHTYYPMVTRLSNIDLKIIELKK